MPVKTIYEDIASQFIDVNTKLANGLGLPAKPKRSATPFLDFQAQQQREKEPPPPPDTETGSDRLSTLSRLGLLRKPVPNPLLNVKPAVTARIPQRKPSLADLLAGVSRSDVNAPFFEEAFREFQRGSAGRINVFTGKERVKTPYGWVDKPAEVPLSRMPFSRQLDVLAETSPLKAIRSVVTPVRDTLTEISGNPWVQLASLPVMLAMGKPSSITWRAYPKALVMNELQPLQSLWSKTTTAYRGAGYKEIEKLFFDSNFFKSAPDDVLGTPLMTDLKRAHYYWTKGNTKGANTLVSEALDRAVRRGGAEAKYAQSIGSTLEADMRAKGWTPPEPAQYGSPTREPIPKFTPGGSAVPGQTRPLSDIMAGAEAKLGQPATTLTKLPTPQETTALKSLQDTAKKIGLDLEAVQGIAPNEYWVSLSTTKSTGSNEFNDWIQNLRTINLENAEKVKKLLVGKFEQKFTAGGRSPESDYGSRRFLPFKSLTDAQKFLDTGDTSLLAKTINQKGEAWTPEKLAQTKEAIAKQAALDAPINAKIKALTDAKLPLETKLETLHQDWLKSDTMTPEEWQVVKTPIEKKIAKIQTQIIQLQKEQMRVTPQAPVAPAKVAPTKTATPEKAVPKEKEAWQMTRAEYTQFADHSKAPERITRIKQRDALQAILKNNAKLGRREGLITKEQWRNFMQKYGDPNPVTNDMFHFFDDPMGMGFIVKDASSTEEKQHYVTVSKALSEGKPVPAEVLKDYPELVKPQVVAPEPARTFDQNAGAQLQEKIAVFDSRNYPDSEYKGLTFGNAGRWTDKPLSRGETWRGRAILQADRMLERVPLEGTVPEVTPSQVVAPEPTPAVSGGALPDYYTSEERELNSSEKQLLQSSAESFLSGKTTLDMFDNQVRRIFNQAKASSIFGMFHAILNKSSIEELSKAENTIAQESILKRYGNIWKSANTLFARMELDNLQVGSLIGSEGHTYTVTQAEPGKYVILSDEIGRTIRHDYGKIDAVVGIYSNKKSLKLPPVNRTSEATSKTVTAASQAQTSGAGEIPTAEPGVGGQPPVNEPPVSAKTLSELDDALNKFGETIASPETEAAFQAQQARMATERGVRASRFAELLKKERDAGTNARDAIAKATSAFKGEYPTKSTGLNLPSDVKDAAYAKIIKVISEDTSIPAPMKSFEIASTTTALDNALAGRPIPSLPGTKGGSAKSRLLAVFNNNPIVKDIIENPEKVRKSLLASALPPEDIDAETADYLRNLVNIPFGQVGLGEQPFKPSQTTFPSKKQSEQATFELILELAGKPEGVSGGGVVPPDKYIRQFSMLPPSQRAVVLATLKDIGLNAVDALGIPKALKFAYDGSMMFRQLGISGARHPISWVKTWKPYFQAMRSEELALALDNEMRTDPEIMRAITKLGLEPYEVTKGATYWDRPETMASKIAERYIPGIRMSNRGAGVAVNYFLTDVGKHTLAVMEKMNASEAEYKAMGSLLNELVGRGEMPNWLKGTAGDILNKLLSSPRYTFSRFEWPTKLFSDSKAVRQEAWSTLIAWVGVGASILAMAKAMGAEVELDPRSADAYKIKIGSKRIDLWVGYAQIIRLAATLAPYVDKDGKVDWAKGSRKTADGKIVAVDRSQIIGRFAQSKEAPGIGAVVSITSGKNYVGEPVDLSTLKGAGKFVKETLAPASLEEMADAYAIEGGASAGLSAIGLAGVGVSTYGNPLFDKWASDFKAYNAIPTKFKTSPLAEVIAERKQFPDTRERYLSKHPDVAAKMFITGDISSLDSIRAKIMAVQLMKENNLTPSDIPGLELEGDKLKYESKTHKGLRLYFERQFGITQPTTPPIPVKPVEPVPSPVTTPALITNLQKWESFKAKGGKTALLAFNKIWYTGEPITPAEDTLLKTLYQQFPYGQTNYEAWKKQTMRQIYENSMLGK